MLYMIIQSSLIQFYCIIIFKKVSEIDIYILVALYNMNHKNGSKASFIQENMLISITIGKTISI